MIVHKDYEPSPFSPGYGRRPLVFGGHEAELAELTEVFETLDFGDNQSVLISGLRGAGKTSMLLELQDSARKSGWLVIHDDASAGLMDRVMETTIPSLLTQLAPEARARVISRVYRDLSDKDQEFITAMAADDGRSKIADIIQRMGVSDQYVQVYKKRLIESGYVQADGRGHVVFSLPYLRDYIRSMKSAESKPPDTDGWGQYPPSG